MSKRIQIRRGLKTNLPTLSVGELGFCTDTKELFIGTNESTNKLIGGGGIIKVTHAELRTIRDAGELVPGQQYQITDYEFTTSQEDTSAANHPFDIIVTADSSYTLSENAKATERANNNPKVTVRVGNYMDNDYTTDNAYVDSNLVPFTEANLHNINITVDGIQAVKGGIPLNGYTWKNTAHYGSYYLGGDEIHHTGYMHFFYISGMDYPINYVWAEEQFRRMDDTSVYVTISLGTYYSKSNLNAWELKYSLDNNDTRFLWADTTNGKGVIYYLKDDFGNECPYDFKNALFKRFKITAVTHSTFEWLKNKVVDSNFNGNFNEGSNFIYFGIANNWSDPGRVTVSTTDFKWMYTFGVFEEFKSIIGEVEGYRPVENSYRDGSVPKRIYDFVYNGSSHVAFDNIIKEYHTYVIIDDKQYPVIALNSIVITGLIIYEEDLGGGQNVGTKLPTNNFFGEDCYQNSLGYIHDNKFGEWVRSNYIGARSSGNTFKGSLQNSKLAPDFSNNMLGDYCSHIFTGGNCSDNKFGDFCSYLTFAENCYGNIIGHSNHYIEAGVSFLHNIIGNKNRELIFGFDAKFNKFGDNNTGIVLGNECTYNTFEDLIGSLSNSYPGPRFIFPNLTKRVIMKSNIRKTTAGNINIVVPAVPLAAGINIEFRKVSSTAIMHSWHQADGDLIVDFQTINTLE
jgi:hypothetical protein